MSYREQLKDIWREAITNHSRPYDIETLEDRLEESVAYLSELECKEYLEGLQRVRDKNREGE